MRRKLLLPKNVEIRWSIGRRSISSSKHYPQPYKVSLAAHIGLMSISDVCKLLHSEECFCVRCSIQWSRRRMESDTNIMVICMLDLWTHHNFYDSLFHSCSRRCRNRHFAYCMFAPILLFGIVGWRDGKSLFLSVRSALEMDAEQFTHTSTRHGPWFGLHFDAFESMTSVSLEWNKKLFSFSPGKFRSLTSRVWASRVFAISAPNNSDSANICSVHCTINSEAVRLYDICLVWLRRFSPIV